MVLAVLCSLILLVAFVATMFAAAWVSGQVEYEDAGEDEAARSV